MYYPKDKNEADKFVAGVIICLHDDKTRDAVMQQLTVDGAPVSARIAGVVTNAISSMLVRVKQQAKRRPNLQLVIKAIKLAILEVSKMAEIAGITVTREDQANAAKIAGDAIDAGQKGEGQAMNQQAQQPQQPVQSRKPILPQRGQMASQRRPLLGGA